MAVAAAAVAAGGAGPSTADGRFVMTVGQTFAADTNVQLDPGATASFGSVTNVGLLYSFAEPGATLSAGAGFNYAAFTGDDNSNLEGLFPSVNVSYGIATSSDTSLNFGLSGRVYPTDTRRAVLPGLTTTSASSDGADGTGTPADGTEPDVPVDPTEPVDTTDPTDPGEGDVESGNRNAIGLRFTASAGVSHQINGANSVSAGASFYFIDYQDDDGTLTPSRSLSFRGNWSHQVSERFSSGFGASLSYFQAENVEDRKTVAFGLTANASYRPYGRLSLFGTLGPTFTLTRENVALAGGGFERNDRQDVGLTGTLGLSFTEGITSGSLVLSQGLAPDSSGRVVNRTTLGGNLGFRTSATSQLNWNASATVRSSLSGSSSEFQDTFYATTGLGFNQVIDSLSSVGTSLVARWEDNNTDINNEFTGGVSISYRYRLTRYLSASVGYEFRLQNQDSGDDTSHRVFLTLTRPFTLIP